MLTRGVASLVLGIQGGTRCQIDPAHDGACIAVETNQAGDEINKNRGEGRWRIYYIYYTVDIYIIYVYI